MGWISLFCICKRCVYRFLGVNQIMLLYHFLGMILLNIFVCWECTGKKNGVSPNNLVKFFYLYVCNSMWMLK